MEHDPKTADTINSGHISSSFLKSQLHFCSGNKNENYKVNDLNVQAEASGGDEEEDDIDWEEG